MQCKEACWCLLGTGYKVSAREGWRQYGCHKQIELVGSPNIFSEEGGGGHAGMGQAFDDFSWYLRRAFNSSINRGVRAI